MLSLVQHMWFDYTLAFSMILVYEKLEEKIVKEIPSAGLADIAEFEFKKQLFWVWGSKGKKQISGTVIGTKFAPL